MNLDNSTKGGDSNETFRMTAAAAVQVLSFQLTKMFSFV